MLVARDLKSLPWPDRSESLDQTMENYFDRIISLGDTVSVETAHAVVITLTDRYGNVRRGVLILDETANETLLDSVAQLARWQREAGPIA
jgi:hypothetical protein